MEPFEGVIRQKFKISKIKGQPKGITIILGWHLFFEFCKSKNAVDFLVPISVKTQHTKIRRYTITLNPCLLAIEYIHFHMVYIAGLPRIGNHPIPT